MLVFLLLLLLVVLKFLSLPITISEAIPVEKMRGKPLCMSHYRWLFGNRIPGPSADSNRFNFIPEERHIVLIRMGHVSDIDVAKAMACNPGSHLGC